MRWLGELLLAALLVSTVGCARGRAGAASPGGGGYGPPPWGVQVPGGLGVPGVGSQAAPLMLPPLETDEGLVVRVLLAECRSPAYADYDEAQAFWAMRAMKAVIHNRLVTAPGRFGAPGARRYADVVTAANQWAGFSRGPGGVTVLAPDVAKRIDELVATANDGPPGPHYRFVRNALDVGFAPVTDPFAGLRSVAGGPVLPGAFGWRREGTGSPGGSFVAIGRDQGGVLAGTQFYALRP